MQTLSARASALVLSLLPAAHALAFEAGWTEINIAGATADSPATVVALYYPTQTMARAIPMGPFVPRVAIRAAPEAEVRGLIVLSHGTGGGELAYTSLAEGLAQRGYLVAALRHPGDNWQDNSLFKRNPEGYFEERPNQVSHVIDAILRDPEWKGRIKSDAKGPASVPSVTPPVAIPCWHFPEEGPISRASSSTAKTNVPKTPSFVAWAGRTTPQRNRRSRRRPRSP